MKKSKLLATAVLGAAFVLTSCGGKSGGDRVPHKDYKGYTTKFYNEDSKTWEAKSNLTWAESYDAIVAKTKSTSGKIRDEYLHLAEDLLFQTNAICPIYYYTDIYLRNPNMTGFYATSLGFKFFHRAKVGTTTDLKICVGPKGDNFDPALNSAVDGAIVTSHVFEGLMRWQAPTSGELASNLEAGQASSYTVSADGKTYTFNLRANSKWSDGTDLKPSDFKYAWDRASSGKLGADYGYMFDVIQGYEENEAETETIKGLSGVVADDTNNTLTVTLNSPCTYFLELTAFPAYYPVKKACVETGNDWWYKDNGANYIGNGPMKVTKMDNKNGGSIEYVPNTNYWDNANTTATKITFSLIEEDQAQETAYKANELDFIDSVVNENIETWKDKHASEYHCNPQIGTYYIIFNVNDKSLNSKLSDEKAYSEFRRALSLLIDRNDICENVGKADQQPANTFVGTGALDSEHEDFTKHSGVNRDGKGYFKVGKEDYENNCNEAVEILKNLGFKSTGSVEKGDFKFTDIPTIKYLYNNGSGHQAIGEKLQAYFKTVGIDLQLENQEWATFLNTRKDGNYSVARNGWLGDYTDPCSFIDMWTTKSGNNDAQFGR